MTAGLPPGGTAARRPAVFLDRDGVLNDVVWRGGRPASPRTLAEFRMAADLGEVVRLRQAGYRLFVVTNQPDLARGALAESELTAMMRALADALHPDDVRWCAHDDAAGCACRKPQPGMLLELAGRWRVDLGASYMVGDSWRDVEAARAAGCRSVLLRRAYNVGIEPDLAAASLGEAVTRILEERGGA